MTNFDANITNTCNDVLEHDMAVINDIISLLLKFTHKVGDAIDAGDATIMLNSNILNSLEAFVTFNNETFKIDVCYNVNNKTIQCDVYDKSIATIAVSKCLNLNLCPGSFTANILKKYNAIIEFVK